MLTLGPYRNKAIIRFCSIPCRNPPRNENTIMRSIRQLPSPRPPLQADPSSARSPSALHIAIPTSASLSRQQANFHKRTFSDCQNFGTAEKRTRRHQRSSSQIFTGGLPGEQVPWGRRIITEVEEEDCSESEEIIRRILRERLMGDSTA